MMYHILEETNRKEDFLLAGVVISYDKMAPLLFTVIPGQNNTILSTYHINCSQDQNVSVYIMILSVAA